MIPSQQEEVFRVFDLVTQQQEYRFQALFSPINIIAQEQVIRTWWESTHLKQPDQVRVLTMNVSHDLYRGTQFDQRRLTQEDLSRGLTHGSDFGVF